MKRSMLRVVKAQEVNMGGFLVKQPLPYFDMDYVDPILLIHHADHKIRGGQKQKDVGVGPHPNRGFSPVTFVYKGGVHHRDSMNNSSVVYSGGTQWMNAGKGVIHSERPLKEVAETGGEMEIIQFWVNTPSQYKMEIPQYFALSDEDTPRVVNDKLIDVAIVSGEMNGVNGPLKGFSELLALRNTFRAGGKFTFHIPINFNAVLYVLNGELEIENKPIKMHEMALFSNDGKELSVLAKEDAQFVILAGEPLNEKVSSYGPFVMNSQSEIIHALNDYQKGKMGFLVEEF